MLMKLTLALSSSKQGSTYSLTVAIRCSFYRTTFYARYLHYIAIVVSYLILFTLFYEALKSRAFLARTIIMLSSTDCEPTDPKQIF
jgi:hypothetical protein